ncbi:restriction endonuclease subunit S [Vibrio vulnificus]|uniref:restriction endonuclease subunit S n=1 Tax=Vibrio vulnificus TaxID=672 RepID=UPI003EDABF74
MSWPTDKLGNLVTIKGGGTPSKNVKEYWNGDIPWASVKDLKSRLLLSTEDSITPLGVEKSATNLIPKGTIIVPTRMALGKVAVAGVDLAINQDLKALFVNDEKVLDKAYFSRFLQSRAKYIESEGKGATVKGITLDFLKGLDVPLPPLNEQKRIAAILDKADAIRQKRKQAIDLAEEFLRSVFLDMFGDPVMNPKGWNTSTLDELVIGKFQNGAYFPKDQYSMEGIEMVHMSDAFYNYVPRGSMKRVVVGDADLKKYKVNHKDILISRRSLSYDGAAKPSLIEASDRPLLFESSLIRITPNPKLMNKLYLFSYLSNEIVKENKIRKYVTGATIKGISQKNLEKIEVLVPPTELQQKFANIFIKVEKLKTQLHQSLLSRDMFQSLSQKAFLGQL